ncbi:hypothetical protein C8P67_1177 [Flavobacterium aquicola]|uniref:Uncharacterized protein n=1 Tax=Flavobacterium aquicola TaxID=1682742 RepID=A0A3E0DYD8_9FLAO|nr:hypothetical protein C8P67_1177 [Flavobacterium aquicola]
MFKSSILYFSHSIITNSGPTTTDIKIPTALIDKFDIVEVICFSLIAFGLVRLYQLFLNSKKS